MELRDLPPKRDPKGGTKTPTPIPIRKAKMQINGYRIDLGVWARFVVQVLLIVGAAAAAYFKFDNRISNLEIKVADNVSSIRANEITKSQTSQTAGIQQSQIDETIRRVANIEAVLRDLAPKVERIDANVMVLMSQKNK